MSTGESYSERIPVPRRRGPAYGELGPPPETAEGNETVVLDRRVEARLAAAILVPVCAIYAGVAYGLYVALGWIL